MRDSECLLSRVLGVGTALWLESRGRAQAGGCRGCSCALTPRKSLMALEQVVPVVPQGTFSVVMRKVPLGLSLPPQ